MNIFKVSIGIVFNASLLATAFIQTEAMAQAEPQKIALIGTYSGVNKSSRSGDCDSFEFSLWEIEEFRNMEKVFGVIKFYDGPCRPKIWPIISGHLDRKVGAIEFSFPTGVEDTGVAIAYFKGSLIKDKLGGNINWTAPNGASRTEMQVDPMKKIAEEAN